MDPSMDQGSKSRHFYTFLVCFMCTHNHQCLPLDLSHPEHQVHLGIWLLQHQHHLDPLIATPVYQWLKAAKDGGRKWRVIFLIVNELSSSWERHHETHQRVAGGLSSSFPNAHLPLYYSSLVSFFLLSFTPEKSLRALLFESSCLIQHTHPLELTLWGEIYLRGKQVQMGHSYNGEKFSTARWRTLRYCACAFGQI